MPTNPPANTLITGATDKRTVSTIAQLLASAVRHHSLYPEAHPTARQNTTKIHDGFRLFFDHHKKLRLDIGKCAILYNQDVVYQGKSDENDITFLLGRDGVEWLEFSRDLELWEIQTLLRVINNNRLNDMEHDGNISTALWEHDLPHIEYKTIDIMGMDLPLLNLSTFRVAPEHKTVQKEYADRDGDEEMGVYEADEADDRGQEPGVITLAAHGKTLWNLTRQEQHQIESLVRKEEDGADAESIIEVLFILLLIENDREEAAEILCFLRDRFLYALQQHHFTAALKIIRTLEKVKNAETGRKKWLCPLIADFLNTASQPESLRDLETLFTSSAVSVTERELHALWILLQILPSSILKTLAPLSCTIDLQSFGKPFLSIFKHFCTTDSRQFADSAKEINEKLCLSLFPFFYQIRTDHSIPVLSGLALHPSAIVRRKAFHILDEWDALNINKLFPLIDDPDDEIRKKIFSLAMKKRDNTIEQRLLKYLEERTEETKNREHTLACYQVLGKIGSARSIPFLQQCLYQRSGLGTLLASGGGLHKEGAAGALMELHLPEAEEVVQKGASHLMPDIRAACRKALGTRHG